MTETGQGKDATVDAEALYKLVKRQLENFWEIETDNREFMIEMIHKALEKLNRSFSVSKNKYYQKNGFSPYNSVQYSVFLYYLSNLAGKAMGGGKIADQIYYLNKIMNGVDWYWAIELPEHFLAEHPVGTVLGRAEYGDYFCVYQGVTVGGNWKQGEIYYPKIGNHVTCYANTSIIGRCEIGDYVVISANSFLKDVQIPDGSLVFGSSPRLVVKNYGKSRIWGYFSECWEVE
ncbi:MAG: transferase [Lachnospiraceae bacterium]|nr:transferase [Lachnospiraceae bacterium]